MSAALIEREPELRSLDAALAQAENGTGTVTLVEGAPGLGKSALLAELAAHARARGLRA
ncbi:MAG: AAA family ATPase [Solirubrobacteraceae bacterium]